MELEFEIERSSAPIEEPRAPRAFGLPEMMRLPGARVFDKATRGRGFVSSYAKTAASCSLEDPASWNSPDR
jgi:hypothetical protein